MLGAVLGAPFACGAGKRRVHRRGTRARRSAPASRLSPTAPATEAPTSSTSNRQRPPAAIAPRMIAPARSAARSAVCWRRCSAVGASLGARGPAARRRTVPAWVPRCLRRLRCREPCELFLRAGRVPAIGARGRAGARRSRAARRRSGNPSSAAAGARPTSSASAPVPRSRRLRRTASTTSASGTRNGSSHVGGHVADAPRSDFTPIARTPGQSAVALADTRRDRASRPRRRWCRARR